MPTFLCRLACDDEEALISEHLPPAPLLRAEAGPGAGERSKEQVAPGIMGTEHHHSAATAWVITCHKLNIRRKSAVIGN